MQHNLFRIFHRKCMELWPILLYSQLVSSVSPYGDHSRWIHASKHAFLLLLPYNGGLHTVHLNALAMRLVVLGSILCIMTDCGFHVVLRDFINVRFMCCNGGYLFLFSIWTVCNWCYSFVYAKINIDCYVVLQIWLSKRIWRIREQGKPHVY